MVTGSVPDPANYEYDKVNFDFSFLIFFPQKLSFFLYVFIIKDKKNIVTHRFFHFHFGKVAALHFLIFFSDTTY